MVAGVLLCALTACGLSTAEQVDDGRPVVLTTFTVLADMVRNVAGDHVRVESITRDVKQVTGHAARLSAVTQTVFTGPLIKVSSLGYGVRRAIETRRPHRTAGRRR